MASRSSIEAGRAHVSLGVDSSAFQRGLDAAKATLQSWGKSIAMAGAGIAAAGASITGPMLYGMQQFTAWGDEMHSTMRQTGMDFQALDTIMDGTRASAEELVPAVAKMSEFIMAAAGGSREANQALAEMGINIEDLQRASQGERLMMFADGLERISDAGQRIARQRDVFGRGGLNLQLQGGRGGIEARSARMDYLEGTQTPADLQLARETSLAFKDMQTAIAGVWREIGAAAAPAMRDFFRMLTDIIVKVRQFITDNRSLFEVIFRVADAMVKAGAVIGVLGGIVYGASSAFTFMSGAVAFLGGLLSFLWSTAVFAATGFGVLKVASLLVTGAIWLYNFAVKVGHLVTYGWVVALAVLGVALAGIGVLIVAVFGGAVIALVAFVGYLLWSRGIIQKVWDAIVEGAGVVGEFITEAFEKVAEFVAGAWKKVTDYFDGPPGAVSRFFDRIVDGAKSSFDALAGLFSRTFDRASAMFSGIVDTASAAWGGIKDAFAVGDWELLWSIVKTAAQLAWEDISFFAVEVFHDWKDAIVDDFFSVWSSLQQIFERGWAFIRTGFYTVAIAVLDIWDQVSEAIAAAMDRANLMMSDQDRQNAADERNRERARRRQELVNERGQVDRDLNARISELQNAEAIRQGEADFLRNQERLAREAGHEAEANRLRDELNASVTEAFIAAEQRRIQGSGLGGDVPLPGEGISAGSGDKFRSIGAFGSQAMVGVMPNTGGETPQQRANRLLEQANTLAAAANRALNNIEDAMRAVGRANG